MSYGKELILDLHDCNADRFTRLGITLFFEKLCIEIDMIKEDLHFWDYEGEPEAYEAAPDHLKGISAIQFIRTSNITIHTLDKLKRVYLNIFSCKDFNPTIVEGFTVSWFGGRAVQNICLERK